MKRFILKICEMIQFIWDFIRYPFDPKKDTNKFGVFLTMLLKQYPAIFWLKPNVKKILALPLLFIFFVFKKK